MPTPLGSLRRLVLTPSLASVGFAGRRFPVVATPATRRLEAIPQAVICGFEWGIDARRTAEVERRLELLDPELRGFGYEGATMAFTVRDAMRGHRTRELMLGTGAPHIFLTYIGIGFAMARLPRPLWRKVLPDLGDAPFHPTMSWLAVDGYGFDRAYFDTGRWVERQRRPKPYPWLGHPAYFDRAVDQGIGRALWFIHGGRPRAVAAAVHGFAPDRRADLWAGVGLACCFAGGAEPDELAEMRESAGGYRDELALGAVFAAKGRDYSGHLPGHTELSVKQLSGLSLAEAVTLADQTEVDPVGHGPVPQYELWRERIRAGLPAA